MSTLDDILQNYQVADDRMVEWSPSAFGIIPMGGLGGSRTLTEKEGQLLDQLTFRRGLLGLHKFKSIVDEAFSEADRRVPPPSLSNAPSSVAAGIANLPAADQPGARASWPRQDGHTDAFRHSYWNALLASEFGENWTENFTTAHEGNPGNYAAREAMDLYNNEVGRRIARQNPRASRSELSDAVLAALDRGELVVIDANGRLAWSSTVPRGAHGVARPALLPGAVPAAVPGASRR